MSPEEVRTGARDDVMCLHCPLEDEEDSLVSDMPPPNPLHPTTTLLKTSLGNPEPLLDFFFLNKCVPGHRQG